MSIGVGVIGTGNIGTAHARNLAFAVSGAHVSLVFDVDVERSALVAAQLGAVVAASVEELINHPSVDAIVIASPDHLHAQQALDCLIAGKATMCEKPLAPAVDDALAVMDAEVALGRRLITMGFMRRFDPGYVALKSELDSGRLGEPLIVHCVHRNQSVGQDHTSVMSLTNSVVHEMDINRWLLGEEYVSAFVMTGKASPHAGAAVKDPQLVFLTTTSGVIVEVESFVNAQFGYEVACEVVASEGTVRLGDGGYLTSSTKGQHGTAVPEQWLGRFGEAYRLEMQAWIDSIREAKGGSITSGPSAWDGYAATAVAGACISAQASGECVPISLVDRPGLY
jgi:myo-inositol 2-dehydrogenase/D-chiro-inositol 1-dehydrogenase